MTDIPAPSEWCFNCGPEKDAHYVFVYDGGGNLISNLKIHNAVAEFKIPDRDDADDGEPRHD